MLERDNHLCQIKLKACRTKANTVDHIIRPEEGGAAYEMANLRASCRSCNMVRHNAAYFREKADAKAAAERNPLVAALGARDERPEAPSVRDSYAPHWHPAGAEPHRQTFTGDFSRSEQCPCTVPGGSDCPLAPEVRPPSIWLLARAESVLYFGRSGVTGHG